MSKFAPRKDFIWFHLKPETRQIIKETAAHKRISEHQMVELICEDYVQRSITNLP